jgi:N-acetylglucosamine-6-sulfatase
MARSQKRRSRPNRREPTEASRWSRRATGRGQRRRIRLLVRAGVVVVVALTLPWPAGGAPQAFRVTEAYLKGPHSAAATNGAATIQATLDDRATAGGWGTALLAGGATVTLTDASHLSVVTPVSGCRRHRGGIRCVAKNMRLSLRSTETPFVYRLHFRVRRLGAGVTGPGPLRSPVRVTLHEEGASDRIDVISDCVSPATNRLSCRDLDRPNIIFIVSDDQRWDTLQYMPRVLDRLAAQGVAFSNSFVTTSLCAPSRASMLTGQYAHRHGVQALAAPHGGATKFVGPDVSTLATWLHEQGYRTGMYGKYITNYGIQCPPFTATCYIPPGWDEWHVFVQQRYYNYKLVENDEITSFGSAEADYSTDVLAAKAVEFIETAHGQPFFLHIGFHAPHPEGAAAPIAAPRHRGLFAGTPVWRPPSYDEDDITDKPSWLAMQPRAATPIGLFLTYGVWGDYVRQTQLETLLAIDEAVEALVAALEATGQDENTVIVFTSDNGHFWGEHRFFYGKGTPHEEAIRVPLVIRYPRLIAAPRSDASLALNIDLAPTLAALAGVTHPPSVDGRSLEPLLRGAATSWRDDFVVEGWNLDQLSAQPSYAGLRGTRWKYVSYPSVGEAELYDLLEDPCELTSLAYDPAYASTVSAMQARLDELLP